MRKKMKSKKERIPMHPKGPHFKTMMDEESYHMPHMGGKSKRKDKTKMPM